MVPVRQPAWFNRRRHTDPPLLWVVVLAGSLLLNGVMTVSLRTYLQPIKPLPNLSPIAVDFVPSQTQSRKSQPKRVAIAPTPPPPTVRSSPPSASPSAPSTRRSAAPTSTIAFGTKPKPIRPKPGKPVSPAALTEKPTSFTVKPSPAPPIQPDGKHPATTATSDPTPSANPQDQTVATSGIRLPDVPSVPDPATNPGDVTTPAPSTQSLTAKATPTKFLMQVKVLDSERNWSPHSAPSALTPFTKTFASGEAGCTLTPDALRGFDQPVTFNLTLDQAGTVAEAAPASPSSSDDQQSYEQLASCTLKTWIFDHAPLSPPSPPPSKTRLAVQVILTKQ